MEHSLISTQEFNFSECGDSGTWFLLDRDNVPTNSIEI